MCVYIYIYIYISMQTVLKSQRAFSSANSSAPPLHHPAK